MKILLLGEYSNVHWTLAEGLRQLGHSVKVLSNGDFWKNYPRDYSLVRTPTRIGGIAYLLRLLWFLPRLRGYDIVQVINPMFLELKAARIFPVYRYLRRHNRKVIMGAFGMDYYWVNTCSSPNSPFRYSDFNIAQKLRHNADADKERADWLGTDKERLNRYIATDCDAIVAGLYEYWRCYQPIFPHKTHFIPMPIVTGQHKRQHFYNPTQPLKIFIGISKGRSEYKGTDIMLKAAQTLQANYPDRVTLLIAEGLPFAQYCQMMQGSDIILDQLYGYVPGMNALQAMDYGIVSVGGGEPENYSILNETQLRPIVNVTPSFESVYTQLEALVQHPERVAFMQQQSIAYVQKHHNYISVAKTYEKLYTELCKEETLASGER